jgi:hypothetical protein
VVAALGGQAGLDLAAFGGQAGLEALLALGLVGQLGGQRLDLAAQLLDPVDGRAVGADHLLLVLGGDQGLVDAVGAQQLAEGRGRPAGVDRPEPLAELAPGHAQAAAGLQDLLAGPGLLDPGAGQGLADLVVVLDQALDPGVHAVDGRLDASRLGPEAGDLPGRGLVGGGAGDLAAHAPDADAAQGDGGQDEDDEEMPNLAQGEVPFAWRVCGRGGTLSRRHHPGKYRRPIRLRLRPGSSGIAPEYFVRMGQAVSPGAPGGSGTGGGRRPAAGRAPRPGAGGPRPGRCRRRRPPRRPR